MKEPWQVFLDEFVREAKRLRGQGAGKTELNKDQRQAAFGVAWEATVCFLVDERHWRQEDASLLLTQFVSSLGSGPSPEIALRRTWEEWQARHDT